MTFPGTRNRSDEFVYRLPLVVVALLLATVSGLRAAGPARVDFNRQIKPLLADRCFACHGPDAQQRKADLRLDLESVAKDVVVAGKPDESELFRRISAAPDERMPPPESKLALTAEEVETIRQWIEQGADWTDHWSMLPVRAVQVPLVNDTKWPNNEIDYFVLNRLAQHGLEPSPPADRETLIRRLYFDLIGLPPTLDQIDAFLENPSPQSYERLVDRLLASDSYGERMAANWLDVARYSDTYGYQVDRDRFVWPWRDWVIRAFNRNLPYDEFITLQLAGDLLPDPTDDQILATTFNRLHPQKVEGGSVPEEFRVEYVADRTETFGTAFLGMALLCARCHDHKYDPISQQEYYQLSAYLDNIDEAGLYSYFTPAVPTPTLFVADDATRAQMAAGRQRILDEERKLKSLVELRHVEFIDWLQGSRVQSPAAGTLIPGRVASIDFERSDYAPNQSVPGRVGQAVRLTGDDGIGLEVGNFRRFEPFSIALWLQVPTEMDRAVVFHRSRAWTDAGSRGYQVLVEEGCLSASLIHFWPGNAIRIKTRHKIRTNQWIHVAVAYDGSSRASGLQIYLDGRSSDCEVVRDNLVKNITGGGGDNITIGQRFRDRGLTGGMVDEFQVFDRQLTPLEIAQLDDGKSLTTALETPADSLTATQRSGLFAYYLATLDTVYRNQLALLRAARELGSKTCDEVSEIMVMRELDEPRPTFVLKRGAYDTRQQRVFPQTPAALPAFPFDAPRNRLGLAQWLTSPEHPLTSRVAANRIWQLLFGKGLVRTPEDFGIQGQRPTHPQLLDWFAHDLVSHGWDLKRMLKQIVMSATYQQSSVVSPELMESDPENLLWARAPSYRLPAEMLRDNALAVSGLLVDRIGGPPAKPYEVAVSFKPIQRDSGEGLYRRSLYTYWKRTGPAPVMMTLDASKRDVCRVRRERTSSPLQAFVLMNGPQFVEAARGLAQRLLQQHQQDSESLLIDLFRILTSRRPSGAELEVLHELYGQQLAYFRADEQRAVQYLKTGEHQRDQQLDLIQLAATSVVAGVLLNHDECLTKR